MRRECRSEPQGKAETQRVRCQRDMGNNWTNQLNQIQSEGPLPMALIAIIGVCYQVVKRDISVLSP